MLALMGQRLHRNVGDNSMTALTLPGKWQPRWSPNKNSRPGGVRITGIVLHADASNRVDSSLDWCRRPESKVSYHLLVGRTGNVFLLVHPEDRAWHAGVSEWEGVSDCNDYTVGVCLSNRNDGETFPNAQLFEVARACAHLGKHYGIAPERITTHALVAKPDGRKTDPKGLDLPKFQHLVHTVWRMP